MLPLGVGGTHTSARVRALRAQDGHFAAMEVPDLLAEDIRAFFHTTPRVSDAL
ncbi:hypothetical protein EV652_12127 [Kribbella steppae]|uniref:Uncharacterized protein n=1 Tax=Kribbella steppae TaxID=2512223 RepID=A0A4R2GX89_9ACTN|nr:hypothetical protein EV652_12127 [Kribbella steppae]